MIRRGRHSLAQDLNQVEIMKALCSGVALIIGKLCSGSLVTLSKKISSDPFSETLAQ